MNIDELSKGAEIEIDVRLNGKTIDFRSDIVLVEDSSVLITTIKVENRTIGFPKNCKINFLYKTDGKLYLWENTVVTLVKYDGDIFHKIDLLGEGKPYNRRDAYRIYVGEDMPVYINTAAGPTALTVLVRDLSETGVGFITKEEMDIKRTFRLKFRENENSMISLSGVIVRKEFLHNLHAYVYGCKFNEKNSNLSKYIMKKQGEQLKSKSGVYSTPAKRTSSMKA